MIHDLRHVRAFLAAARVGNFTRAAMELHLSQSAFTVQIRQLEDAVGVTLFDRGKRRVALTAAGRELLAPLERLVIDAEAIVSQTRQLTGLRRGIVSLAVLPSVAEWLAPAVLEKFTQAYPGIVVQVNDIVSEKAIEAVKKEEVDFGIASKLRFDRDLRTTPLFVDRLCAFAPSAHPVARRGSVTFREILSFPLVLTGKDSSVRELLERAVRREPLPLKIAYETNYMSTAIGMVRAGLGVAVLPEVAANGQPRDVKCLPIVRPVLSRRIEIFEKKDRSLSPAAQKMTEIFRNTAKTAMAESPEAEEKTSPFRG